MNEDGSVPDLGWLLEGLGSPFSRKMPTDVVGDDGKIHTLQVPHYGPTKINPLECSVYVRMAAKELFDLDYSFADAWERTYKDRVKLWIPHSSTLKDCFEAGALNQGDIVGYFNPESRYNDTLDSRGELVQFTHVALFLGREPHSLEPLTAEQFIAQKLIRTEREQRKSGLIPKIIICSKSGERK